MRTRVKICGITRPQDGLEAARLGADAIGLVFYPPSPRNVSIEQAQAITQGLPSIVRKVALVVDADQTQIEQILDAVPVDLLQFHGNESPEACSCYNHPYIKALRVRDDTDIAGVVSTYADAGAKAILLDAYQPGTPGGTGSTFDWSCIPQGLSLPVILAGGLTPENVAQAVEQVHPYAVDVSGGVESEPGIKDAQKIASFIKAVAGSS